MADAMRDEEILKLSPAEYSAVIETLVGGGFYEKGCRVLLQRKVAEKASGPFTLMVDFVVQHHSKGYVSTDLAAFERFMAGIEPPDRLKPDHAKAIEALRTARANETVPSGK
jgi:hypothetical protein